MYAPETLDSHAIASRTHAWLLLLGFICTLSSILAPPAHAQLYPPDFSIVGVSGGVEPWSENEVVRIDASGAGEYVVYKTGDDISPLLADETFNLSVADLDAIWSAVVAQDFFSLSADTTDDTFDGGSFTQLAITANGMSHTVTVQNTASAPFDAIVAAINAVVPSTFDLGRNVPGIRRGAQAPPLGLDPLQRGAGDLPGTTVAFCCSLKDAARGGRVSITSTGGALGETTIIGVDNTTSANKDTIKAVLQLEFYCDGATVENMQRIKNAVEARWSNRMTSSGKVLQVCVAVQGDSSAVTEPGTPGFHQIKLTDTPPPGKDAKISFVQGRGSDFNINTGTGEGCWEVTSPCIEDIWAHECGHLLGLADRYDDWRKKDDGLWHKRGGGAGPLTSADLATLLDPKYSGDAVSLQAYLEAIERICPHQDGHFDDIMARKDQMPQQAAVDFIANDPGLKISLKPGDILVNENESRQNLIVTEARDIFVPSGAGATFPGVKTACIDEFKPVPSPGDMFDVVSKPSEWNGFATSEAFQALIDLIDELGLSGTTDAQKAIFWFTDLAIPLSQGALDLLEQAGVDTSVPPESDVPHVTNPFAADGSADFVVPTELVDIELILTPPNPFELGQTADATGSVQTPDGTSANATSPQWGVIEAPTGSTAQPVPDDAFFTSFHADQKGIFELNFLTDVQSVNTSSRLPYPVALSEILTLVVIDDATETFETGSFAASPFAWTQGGTAPWTVTDATVFSGGFAAQSGDIGDGESSSIEIEVDTDLDWDITFARRVSSQLGDNLRFTVNGVLLGSWSGEVPWDHQTWDLFPGTFTLKWEYLKDGAGSEGYDRAWIDDVFLPVAPVGSDAPGVDAAPIAYRLAQNFPNPFSQETRIRFDMPVSEEANLTLFDATGRQISVLLDRVLPAGAHEVVVDGSAFPHGVYFYRLKTGRFTQTRKLVLSERR